MRKNGFTLIELLAVIVILAIIALIAIPLIMNVIDDASMGSFKNTAYGIVRAAESECMANLMYGSLAEREIIFEDYQMGIEKIKYRGKGPKSGTVYINNKCEVAVAIHDGNKWCARKELTSDEVIVSSASEAECKLDLELGLTEEQLKCLINNQCDGVTLPEDYVGTEGQWVPIASRQDLDNIGRPEPATNMVFGAGTVFEKTWNDEGYTANEGRFEQRYIVVNNFDMGTSEFTPIGYQSRPFCGVFDGNYKKISNLTSTTNGLFYMSDPTGGKFTTCYIQNVSLTNVNINASTDYVGGIARLMRSSYIKNSYVEGNITGFDYVGGLVGQVQSGVITNSYAKGKVIGIEFVGGVVGYYSSVDYDDNIDIIENVYAIVEVEGDNSVGGVFGEATVHTIRNVHAQGKVKGVRDVGGVVGRITGNHLLDNIYAKSTVEGKTNVGGIVGYLTNNEVKNSYFEGNVTGDDKVGGLIGASYTKAINNVYAKGDIIGINRVGGLIGSTYDDVTNNAYTEGNVTGVTKVGGLMGESYSTRISNSYSKSNVTGINNSQDVGGFVGIVYYTDMSNCYATGNVNGHDNVGGFIGYGTSDQINNSYVINEVVGTGNYIGGFIGANSGARFNYVYAANKKLVGQGNVGGLIGGPEYSGPPISYSYWDTTISNVFITAPIGSMVGIEGKTTAEMKNQSTYVNWDFTNIWTIKTNEYPKLKWQS